jgi:NADH dehydrogenase
VSERIRILVVGAGFAGASAIRSLRHLPEDRVQVTLVDRCDEYVFVPLIHEVAAGRIHPRSIVSSIPRLCRSGNCDFVRAEVEDVDLESRTVKAGAATLPYDYLVLAPGTVSALPPEELSEHFTPFGTLEDALGLRERVRESWRAVRLGANEPGRLTAAIAGGGTTGVELAFELASLFRYLKRRLGRPLPLEPCILLLEAEDRLMGWLDPYFHDVALRKLKEAGIEVRLNTPVERADAGGVQAGDERFPAAIRVWAAGISVPPLIRDLPAGHDELGRLRVDHLLNLPEHPEVYALGDIAAYTDPRYGVLPPTASVAVQQGPWAAGDIKARLRGRRREPFRFWNRGYIVSTGPDSAIAEVTGRRFEGRAAQALYRSVLLYYMDRRERILTTADWAMDPTLGRLGFS